MQIWLICPILQGRSNGFHSFEKYTHKVKYVIVLLQSSNHDAIIDVNVILTFPLKKGIAIWRLSFDLKGFVECLCCPGSWSSFYSSGLTIATVALVCWADGGTWECASDILWTVAESFAMEIHGPAALNNVNKSSTGLYGQPRQTWKV